MAVNNFFLAGVIDRLEGQTAVIRTDDGQEIKWSVKNLPAGATAGLAVKITIKTNAEETIEREDLAKALLNEILAND